MPAKQQQITLNFSRREYKYLIKQDQIEALKRILYNFNNLDCNNRDKQPYIVRSLYYDSQDFIFFNEKVEGDAQRKKIRLRVYSDKQDDGPIFIECKRKNNDWIYKTRQMLNSADYELLRKKNIFDQNKFTQFQFLFNLYNLSPKILVKYERISFIDPVIDFKISLDRQLQASFSADLYEKELSFDLLSNNQILEIKFKNLIPNYFCELVKNLNLSQITFSKYVFCLTNLFNIV